MVLWLIIALEVTLLGTFTQWMNGFSPNLCWGRWGKAEIKALWTRTEEWKQVSITLSELLTTPPGKESTFANKSWWLLQQIPWTHSSHSRASPESLHIHVLIAPYTLFLFPFQGNTRGSRIHWNTYDQIASTWREGDSRSEVHLLSFPRKWFVKHTQPVSAREHGAPLLGVKQQCALVLPCIHSSLV